jgi:hypothetical protein
MMPVVCQQEYLPAWRAMTSNRVNCGHLSGILLVAAAISSACPSAVFAQDLESRSPSALRSEDDSSSVPGQGKKHLLSADDAVVATLPDAPTPQDQTPEQSPPSPADSGKHLNQFPILSPGLSRAPLTTQDKFLIYIHKSFGPPAVILPAFGAGFGMLNPPSKYPKDWKDGATAFGRNYGYRLADRTSRNTAQFLTGAFLHEDPRYLRSTSANPFVRTVHALAFTIFDKTDSGRTTFAASNFAAAAAGGFAGMGILPHGYNDATHAEQHMASEFLQIGIGNVLTEFEPQWGPWAKKLRIPKILPGWWVREH